MPDNPTLQSEALTALRRLWATVEAAVEDPAFLIPSVDGDAYSPSDDYDVVQAALLAAPAPHEDTVRLPEEGACERCHQPNPLCWFTKSQYWNTVTAYHPFSFLCPTCFIALAKDVGIDPTAWELVPESLRAADLLAQPPVRSEEEPVAWQRCPICEGRGVVAYPPGVTVTQPSFASSSTSPYPCPLCNGRMIVLPALPQEGPTRAEVEALRDFAQEFADEPCFFGDNCPTFGSRHGRCNNCKARNVLALFPKVTP